MVEDGQGNGCFPDATNTNECDGIETFCKGNDTFNEFLPSKKALGGGGGGSPSTLDTM